MCFLTLFPLPCSSGGAVDVGKSRAKTGESSGEGSRRGLGRSGVLYGRTCPDGVSILGDIVNPGGVGLGVISLYNYSSSASPIGPSSTRSASSSLVF